MTESTSLSDYGSWTADSVKDEIEDLKKGGAGAEFLTIAADTTKVIRILPVKGGASPFIKFWKHTYTDHDTQKLISFACPKMNSGEHCPVCAQSMALKRSASKVDQDLSWEYRAKKRVLVNVLDRETGTVKIWEFGAPMGRPKGKTIYEQLLNFQNNPDFGGDIVTPGPQGFDINIQRKGTGKTGTSYGVYMDRHPRPLADNEADALKVLTTQHDIALYATPPTQAQLPGLVSGKGWGSAGDEGAVQGSRGHRALSSGGGGYGAQDNAASYIDSPAVSGTDDDIQF